MPFGRSRAPKIRKFFFSVAKDSRGSLPALNASLIVRKRPLVREEADGVIDVRHYVANMRVTSSRQVTLTVCVDPAANDLDPGTYRGLVVSDDPRIENVSVPLTVTLQYPRWRWVALYLGLAVIITGSFFVWASSRTRRDDGSADQSLPGRLGEWVAWLPANIVGIAVGAVAAASVFTAVYLNDPGWGAVAPTDWFTLIAAMFTAFTAGLTGGRASLELPRKKREKVGGTGEHSPTKPTAGVTARDADAGGRRDG